MISDARDYDGDDQDESVCWDSLETYIETYIKTSASND